MFQVRRYLSASGLALTCAVALGGFTVHADKKDDRDRDRDGMRPRKVFVIAMENHNWTQPATGDRRPQQIFMNPAAPFINSLVNGTSGISDQVAYATNYINAASAFIRRSPTTSGPKRARNFGVFNDDNPYHADCSPDTVQTTDQHLSAFLTKARKTWKSYQEDTNVDLTTNVPLPTSSWTVPLFSHSGVFTAAGLNVVQLLDAVQLRGQAQSDGVLHAIPTADAIRPPSNPLRRTTLRCSSWRSICRMTRGRLQLDHAEPVQRPAHGAHRRVRQRLDARQRPELADIAQGDNFLARVVPLDHGVGRLQGPRRDRAVVGRERRRGHRPVHAAVHRHLQGRARERGAVCRSRAAIEYSHSSLLRTMQEIFDVDPTTASRCWARRRRRTTCPRCSSQARSSSVQSRAAADDGACRRLQAPRVARRALN